MKPKISILTIDSKKHGRHNVLIDFVDFEKINHYTWYLDLVKSDNKLRVRSCLNGKLKSAILLHRFILNAKKGEIVDHINMNPLDNRRENLRIVTKSQNMQNRKKQSNNTSGHKGVSWSKKDKKWRATIRSENGWKFLGNFEKIEDAILARNDATKNLHKEYGRIDD
jgi:hypothetical protein